MNHRFSCTMLVALLALQAVTASAFANASVGVGSATASHDCADRGECPCCPEGVTSMLACSTACAAVAAVPAMHRFVGQAGRVVAINGAVHPLSSQSYLPLHPPPIR